MRCGNATISPEETELSMFRSWILRLLGQKPSNLRILYETSDRIETMLLTALYRGNNLPVVIQLFRSIGDHRHRNSNDWSVQGTPKELLDIFLGAQKIEGYYLTCVDEDHRNLLWSDEPGGHIILEEHLMPPLLNYLRSLDAS